MPNNNNDWLSNALDRHPAEPVPPGFADDLKQRLDRDLNLKPSPAQDSEPQPSPNTLKFQRWVRPILMSAAAALLLSIGFMLGAGSGTGFGTIQVDPGGQLAETEIDEIYQNRELLQAWDLISDQDLELSFRQLDDEESDWLDDLLDTTESTGLSTPKESRDALKGAAGGK